MTREYVAMQECAEYETSTLWIETAVFPETATLGDVNKWATLQGGACGRLMIRPAQRPMEAE